jgi:hypothetical protein
MALAKQLVKTIPGFDGQLTTQAQFKVSSLSGSKHNMSALVTGVVDGHQVYTEEHFFVPNLDGHNFIKQAYEHLKTLPEFAGATDC